jgi:hypothetical protein
MGCVWNSDIKTAMNRTINPYENINTNSTSTTVNKLVWRERRRKERRKKGLNA